MLQQNRKNIDNAYQIQKEMHIKNEANCCKIMHKDINILTNKPKITEKPLSIFEDLNALTILQNSSKSFQNLESQFRQLSVSSEPTSELSVISPDEIYRNHINYSIAEMGNYAICLEKKKKLRNPKLTDAENFYENQVYFGNPYKRTQTKEITDEKALESELLSPHAKPIIEKENPQNIEKTKPKYLVNQENIPEEKISQKPPSPIKPEILEKSILPKSEDINEKLYTEFYTSLYGNLGNNQRKIMISIKKDLNESIESIKYEKLTTKIQKCIFCTLKKKDSINLLKEIRNFRPNSADIGLIKILQEILDIISAELGNSYRNANKMFLQKIEGMIKFYKPASPALKFIKKLLDKDYY